jgi:hypothetical protein
MQFDSQIGQIPVTASQAQFRTAQIPIQVSQIPIQAGQGPFQNAQPFFGQHMLQPQQGFPSMQYMPYTVDNSVTIPKFWGEPKDGEVSDTLLNWIQDVREVQAIRCWNEENTFRNATRALGGKPREEFRARYLATPRSLNELQKFYTVGSRQGTHRDIFSSC